MVPDVIGPTSLDMLDPEEHRVVFLANVSDPSIYAHELIDFVRDGGGLMLSLGSNVSADRYNTTLGDILPANYVVQKHYIRRRRKTAIPNLEHPFSVFRRAEWRFS